MFEELIAWVLTLLFIGVSFFIVGSLLSLENLKPTKRYIQDEDLEKLEREIEIRDDESDDADACDSIPLDLDEMGD